MKHFYYVLLLGTLMLFSVTSCSEPDIEDRPDIVIPDPNPDPDPEATTGHVTLTTNWGGIPVPAGLQFHLYPTSGEAITKECPASGFDGDLKADTYRVLAVNTDPTNVTFANLDDYATATATLTKPQDRPNKAYAFSRNQLAVIKGSTLNEQIAARALTKNITLSFTFSDISRVQSLTGKLQGVYTSVLLATGEGTAAAKANAPHTAVNIVATLSDNQGTASAYVLGLLNPNGGKAYNNVLKMTLISTSGQTSVLEYDLTQQLTQSFSGNGGALPGTLKLSVPVTVPSLPPSVGGGATVPGWDDSGSGNTNL